MNAPPPSASRSLLKGAGLVALGAAASAALGALLPTRPLAALLASALAVDWLASSSGASFHEGPRRATGRGVALGAAVGAGAALVASGLALASGLGRLVPHEPSLLTLGLGLLAALATSVRDELLFRWLPSKAFGPAISARWLAVLQTALGAAPVVLSGSPGALAVALGQGALSALLLHRTGELGPSIGASSALFFLTQSLLSSTLEVRWASGSLVPLTRASGPGAFLLGAVLLLLLPLSLRVRGGAPAGSRPGVT